MLILYDYFRSSAAFRTRIALNYKGLEYSKHDIDLRYNSQNSELYLKINPAGLVPTLINSINTPVDASEYDSMDDDTQSPAHQSPIHQSIAIIEYLEEEYPDLPKLLPENPKARAYVREIALTIACDIHPLNNLRVLNYLTQTLKHNEIDKNLWYQHWILQGLNSLEQIIQNSIYYNGTFCYYDQFTIADVCLIPQLFNAKRFNCDLSKYPILCAIEEKCLSLDAVKRALPQ
jgi:maleylacetoacetate isomerase